MKIKRTCLVSDDGEASNSRKVLKCGPERPDRNTIA